jgi:hypothetical protein
MNRLIIGSTDKSAFLLQCMTESFESGFMLIDPTGHLATAMADRVPVEITERTFYLDPADIEHPVGLNVLQGAHKDARHQVAESICAYFEAMWPNGWGARSGYILLNCLRLLLDTPSSTFLGIPKLLTNKSYRTKCLIHCEDPIVRNFWEEEFEGWPEKFRLEAIAPLQNKLGALLTSPIIRNILGQRYSTFALDRGHIIIANLDRAKLGDQTAFLLGSLLITRSAGPIYITDLGFFGSDHLATLLPQGRFNLALGFLDELPRKLQQAVLAIPDKTVFRTAREDAERLAFYMGVMNPSVLTDLDPAEARIRDGVIRPTAPSASRRLEAIRRRSRACHSRPRRKVEGEVARILGA